MDNMMIKSNDKFIILPSNLNSDRHPANSPSEFTVDLNRDIYFGEPMKCALFDIITPSIQERTRYIYYKYVYAPEKFEIGEMPLEGWNLNDHMISEVGVDIGGRYNLKEFLEYLNQISDKYYLEKEMLIKHFINEGIFTDDAHIYYSLAYPYFEYRLTENKLRVYSGALIHGATRKQIDLFIKFDKYFYDIFKVSEDKRLPDIVYEVKNKYLQNNGKPILNFVEFEVYFDRNPFTTDHYINWYKPLIRTEYRYLVMCDFIGESIFNTKKLKILKNLVYQKNVVSDDSPRQLIYLPVKVLHLKNISVKIVDYNFNPVNFKEGVSYLTIHFKNK